MTDQPLGLPQGSVRAILSIGVVVVVAAIGAFLIVQDSSSDLSKLVVGGLIAALGNVIGSYFGSRKTETE